MPVTPAGKKNGSSLKQVQATLTPLQARFIEFYLKDLKPTKAARLAGFSDPSYGRQLIRLPHIKAHIKHRQNLAQRATSVTVESVVDGLTELHRKALLKDDLGTATRVLELLGRHVGAFERDNSQKGNKVYVQMNFKPPGKLGTSELDAIDMPE